MMAYRYVPGTSTVVPQRVPIPEPKEGEVLLRVQAAGLCHSDLHVLHGVYRGTPMGDLSVRFAEFVTAPAENVVLVPEGVSPAQASACTDALLTPYHGIREIANVKSHENVVVIGLGGVGMNALKIAKLFGNEVFASDVKRIAAPGGRVLLLGLGAAKLEWNVAANLEREVALLMSFWGTKKALSEVLELVKEGKLKPEVEERKMSELPESVTAMDEGRVKGRLAFVP
ncbi:hypothetical protein RQP46_010382 [Phenoliferia psychrophenolica]